ncbi:hypothetical protein GF342_04505 [Candidatus Woesearchaeota archaeon]|nr:hypothetical protein [Candidatus Woesearchaeota archaeon]
MVTLVVVDHHRSDFIDKEKVSVPTFETEEEFVETLRQYLDCDYDMILADADVDGYTSAIIYALDRKLRDPAFKCFRVPITREHLDIFEKNGVQTIIALDWFPLYGTDVSLFENVVLLNPRFSKLFENCSCSELIYRATKHKTPFMRDINAVGVVSDYGFASGMQTILQTVNSYNSLFLPLVELGEQNKINRYNVYQSKFKQLSEIFWAPYIINGEEGVQEIVQLIVNNEAFTYWDVFNYAHHPAIHYLRRAYHHYQQMVEEEEKHFAIRKKEFDHVIIYEPKTSSPGFISKYSSELTNRYSGKVFLLKIKINSKTKYSARQRGLLLDLGRLFEELGIGGGHPAAAGGMTEDPEGFEKAFIEKVNAELEL